MLGNFLDNHDVKRFLAEQTDVALFHNAIAYTMMAAGIPIIYQGTELHFSGGDDPRNRESMWPDIYETGKRPSAYHLIKTLNALRNQQGAILFQSKQKHLWTNDDLHVFMRGEVIVVVTNVGQGRSFDRTIRLPVRQGVLCRVACKL